MFSRFFIDRPIFASVLSILITLAGGLALFTLPLAQFPRVTPPTVSVRCSYPGASAQDVADAVAAPIEEEVNGVEGMMYMSSQCTNDGSYNLTVTFRQGVDVNMAQVLVQNRVSLALPKLPDVIKATGVTTLKQSPDILMGIAINSPRGTRDQLYLSNYALRRIKDELVRLHGVSDVFLFGQRDYSMRVWLDPQKLASHGLTATDVVRAIREQNAPVATGMIGQPPVARGQQLQLTLHTTGRLDDVEQFENIILRAKPDGRVTRLKDVSRVELGAKNQDVDVRLDGRASVFLAVFQAPDANALDTADKVVAKMTDLAQDFPDDVIWQVGFDTTPYTRESIHEVFKTLRDAVILVALVVLVFLQNWRSAIIPLIAVPVAIIGTFAVMAALGFSLNNLTLFGLVLAIGIVVDDAIVVVEAVEHQLEQGHDPREATIRAMDLVSEPVVAIALVLSAVFVPCAFISGITGLFFRQFAMTIAVSTLISAFNSLTLSPALTALMLRRRDKVSAPPLPRLAYVALGAACAFLFLTEPLHAGLQRVLEIVPGPLAGRLQPASHDVALGVALVVGAMVGWFLGRGLNWLLAWAFRGFDRGFRAVGWVYGRAVGFVLRGAPIALVVYAGMVGLTYFGILKTQRGFIPSQDMGYLLVNVQLPDSASMERTGEVMHQVGEIALQTPGVRHATTIAGQSFVLNAFGSNFGSMFINLKDYQDRRSADLHAVAIANRLRQQFDAQVYDATVAVFPPPPVRGVGRAGGFAIMIEDRGDLGPMALQEQMDNLSRRGNQTPGLAGLFSVFRANVPQLRIEPDPRETVNRGVSIHEFADALRAYQASLYVNDFNLFDRSWQVIVQAEPAYRNQMNDLRLLTVRNDQGRIVPLGSVASVRETNGPLVLTRYNMYPAASLNGAAAPGISSRAAIDIMQQLADAEIPASMATEWTDMSYLELLAGNTAMIIFVFAVVMVFLVLAAQYESWSLPLAVILVVPMCLLSAIAGVRVAHMDINIFTQIGFVVLVGLASKNAILIVEFAKEQRDRGVERVQASLDACHLRFRPIIMTSLAFILGVLPLLLAHGAGMEMRQTLGTAVFSGMLGVTFFGIFLTPVFFVVVNYLSESRIFRWPAMERLRTGSLAVVSLGAHQLRRLMTRRPTPRSR
jgi:multidrug efflux pump